MLKNKIIFVIQRYGAEVNGGAEVHCRLLAEQLAVLYDVQILTSCAKDYVTWANEYPAGESYLNGVKIIRFAVPRTPDYTRIAWLNKKLNKRKRKMKWLKLTGLLPVYDMLFQRYYEAEWIKEQGPYLPDLVNYIKDNVATADAFIFFTYLYYPTVAGLKQAAQKAIFIPTAHNEQPIYMQLFKKVFSQPRAILYNTLAEKAFVNQLFNINQIYSDVVGIGVDGKRLDHGTNTPNFVDPNTRYFIYIGRIETAKQCGELIRLFINYKQQDQADIKLIFVGRAFMDLVEHPDIIYTGFVSEQIKLALLNNAQALIMPSVYESLSLVTLESMAQGVPVIANAHGDVLKDHINNSKAGFLYHDQQSFNTALNNMLNPDLDTQKLAINGKRYIAENYTWPVVIDKITKAVEHVIQSNQH